MTERAYRPRSSLTAAIINKMNSEQELKLVDDWYAVNLAKIKDDRIRGLFIKLSADEETQDFIKTCSQKSDWIFTQIYHNLAKAFLGMFYCQTDVNGILHRGSMFVLSRDQFQLLTESKPQESVESQQSMIDLGAGDGAVTMPMAQSFKNIYATETSKPMQTLLKSKDIKVLPVESWMESGPFDLISCMNLLDRADTPVTILQHAKNSLKPTGLLVVALVLPYKPYVESNATHKPTEPLNISGQLLENQIESAVAAIESVGFDLVKWSRVPYLCEGDLTQTFYHLSDIVMIFKHKNNPE